MSSDLSLKADPQSLATDVFQQSWKRQRLLYAISSFFNNSKISIKGQIRRGGCNFNNTKLVSITLI